MSESSAADTARPGVKAWWTLGVISFISVIDWADRSVIGTVIEPIREEFGFSDTQMGLLGGIAFTTLYVVAGIFFGRLADRKNRRNLLVGVLAFWSSMTLMFGMAKNFGQLFLARVGIGAGTGGTNPTAVSMIGDLFPSAGRGKATAIYMTAGVVGFSLGFYAGGIITEQYGWRTTMISFGVLGLTIAALCLLLIDEPARVTAAEAESKKPPSLVTVFQVIWSQKSLVHFSMGVGLLLFTEGVGNVWTIPYFQRSFGMGLAEASSLISVLWLISGIIGVLVGGTILDELLRQRQERVMKWLAGVALCMLVLSLFIYLSGSRLIALTALFLHTMVYSLSFSAMIALPLVLLSSRMHATGYAITAFARYLFAGLGPVYAGTISDALATRVGDESLRYAMLSSSLFLLWAAAHFFWGSKTFRQDYDRAKDA